MSVPRTTCHSEQAPGQLTHPGAALIRSGKNPHSDNTPIVFLCLSGPETYRSSWNARANEARDEPLRKMARSSKSIASNTFLGFVFNPLVCKFEDFIFGGG